MCLFSLACLDNVAITGKQPSDASWLNWGNHLAEGFCLYFLLDPWARWESGRYNALEGVISRSGRGLLGTFPDSRPAPCVSTSARQLIQSSPRVWLDDKEGGVLWRVFHALPFISQTQHICPKLQFCRRLSLQQPAVKAQTMEPRWQPPLSSQEGEITSQWRRIGPLFVNAWIGPFVMFSS